MGFDHNEKYITIDGEDHKKIEKQEKERRYKMPRLAFGELIVDRKLNRKLRAEVGNIQDEDERWRHIYKLSDEDNLELIRSTLASMEPMDDFINVFICEAIENPKIKGRVPDDLGIFEEWLIKFSKDKERISDSLLEEMLRYHVEIYRKEAEIFDHKVEVIKTDFLSCLSELIKEKKLPSFINIDEISSRINDVDVQLDENVHAFSSRNVATALDDVIEFSWYYSDGSEDEIKKILFHELVHVSAGKMIQKIQSPEKEDGTYSVIKKRGGLGVSGRVSGNRRWINEGTTEMIAKIISEQAGIERGVMETYGQEQEVIENLIKKGVPREYFIEAFFENYDEEIKGMPKWKRLVQKIHEVDGGGFLKRGEEDVKERYKKRYEEI